MTIHHRTLLLVALVTVALGATGCSHHVFSPPARTLPLESPATLAPGETGVAVEGGHHGEVFGPDITSGTLRVRHGAVEDVDVSAEANVLHVHGNPAAGTHPNAYSLRLGTKYQLVEHFAFTMGLGGGGSAGGYFFSPDVGVVLGYENEYLVPFMSLRTTLSLPIDPREVETTEAGNEERQFGTPQLTGGLAWNAGLRLPLPLGEAATDREKDPDAVHGSLVLGIGMTHLYDGDEDANMLGVAAGGEIVF